MGEGETTLGGPAGSRPRCSREGRGAAAARPSLITVIPAWKDALYLRDTVEALRGAAKVFPRADLIIVASGKDGTLNVARDAARAYDLGETWVIGQRPLGKMQALADGIDLVAGSPAPDYLLLLDADTQLEADALVAAKEFLDNRKEIVGVGPLLSGYLGGIGDTFERVENTVFALEPNLGMIPGPAMFFDASAIWPHLNSVFSPNDYPVHIDYQICARVQRLTAKHFAIAPEYRVQTERGRGWEFVEIERRHYRGIFGRGNIRSTWRILAGAARNAIFPFLIPFMLLSFLAPKFWPIPIVYLLVSARAVWRFYRRYRLAVRANFTPINGAFGAYLVDNWFVSFAVLLAAFDVFVRRYKGDVQFKGSRRLYSCKCVKT